MAGDSLHAITEEVQGFGTRTVGRGESIGNVTTALTNNMHGNLGPNFIGAGGTAFFTVHDEWDIRNKQLVAQEMVSKGEKTISAGQQQDRVDLDIQAAQRVPAFGSAITTALLPGS